MFVNICFHIVGNINNADLGYRKFRSQINPSENVSAEEELKKEIKYVVIFLKIINCNKIYK